MGNETSSLLLKEAGRSEVTPKNKKVARLHFVYNLATFFVFDSRADFSSLLPGGSAYG